MGAGQPCRFVVVTTGAGSGTLGILVDGPAKVAVVCTEVDEGYEFSYTPTAPGDYFIAIKYCNVTIAGCPHKAVIAGQSLLTALRLLFCIRPAARTDHRNNWFTAK